MKLFSIFKSNQHFGATLQLQGHFLPWRVGRGEGPWRPRLWRAEGGFQTLWSLRSVNWLPGTNRKILPTNAAFWEGGVSIQWESDKLWLPAWVFSCMTECVGHVNVMWSLIPIPVYHASTWIASASEEFSKIMTGWEFAAEFFSLFIFYGLTPSPNSGTQGHRPRKPRNKKKNATRRRNDVWMPQRRSWKIVDFYLNMRSGGLIQIQCLPDTPDNLKRWVHDSPLSPLVHDSFDGILKTWTRSIMEFYNSFTWFCGGICPITSSQEVRIE